MIYYFFLIFNEFRLFSSISLISNGCRWVPIAFRLFPPPSGEGGSHLNITFTSFPSFPPFFSVLLLATLGLSPRFHFDNPPYVFRIYTDLTYPEVCKMLLSTLACLGGILTAAMTVLTPMLTYPLTWRVLKSFATQACRGLKFMTPLTC